jgi:type I restriction enzyme S subunit
VKLDDVVEQVKSRVPSGAGGPDVYVPGGSIGRHSFEVTEWLPFDDGLIGPAFTMVASAGDVLYKSRVPHGVAVADRRGICSNTTYVLRTRDEGVLLQRLIPHILSTTSFLEHESLNDKGSTNLYLNFSDIARYEFALPPVDKQQRIVELLSKIDGLSRRSEAVLQAAEVAVTSFVSQFEPAVETRKLSSLLSLLTKGTTPTSIGARFSPEGARFLKAENVIDGRIDYGVESFIDSDTNELLSRSRLQKGDVLLTIAGTIGRSAVVDDTDLPANCNQAVAILRPSAELNPWFLSAWLGGVRARRQIGQCMVSNTISNLSLGVIGDLDVPVLTAEAQSAAVSGILAARSITQAARNHRGSTLRVLEAIRSDLLSGGSANV